jgi:hypothetical protein
MPLCRAYARQIVKDKPADSVMCALSSIYFRKVHGYWPTFRHPRSFSEMVWAKMLFDRDPMLTLIQDKYRVREYVASEIGSRYLVPLLWHGTNPQEIPFDELPDRFVIKATHGCHYNIVVKDKSALNKHSACAQLREWLAENFCKDKFLGLSWGYKNIAPSIIIEQFLGDGVKLPVDYKFRCVGRRVRFMTVQYDHPNGLPSILTCNRNGDPIPCEVGKGLQYRGVYQRPPNYDEMLNVAEKLGGQFDFVRVDLYSVDARVYFGELTPYPSAGCIKFTPQQYDFEFGRDGLPEFVHGSESSKGSAMRCHGSRN